MRRSTYHHGDLRRALVDAALEIIAVAGPEAMTLRQIARAVGVDHTAVYRHFEDKRALLAEVSEQGFTALAAAMRQALEEGADDPFDRVSRMAGAYVAFALDHPSHFRVMLGPRLNEDGRHPSLERPVTAAFSIMRDEIERGQASGAFHSARATDLAVSVWTVAHGYATLVLMRRIRVKDRATATDYFRVVLAPVLVGLA
jgi:AcrR family transcriptional regulator